MKEKILNLELIKNLIQIILLTLTFSVAYTLIVYGNFNFIEIARDKSNQKTKEDIREVSIEEAQVYFDKAIIIDARSEKDFFVGSWSLQGINHYDGTDLKLIYYAPNTRVMAGLIFEKDVFITLLDIKTSSTRVLHGRLKE